MDFDPKETLDTTTRQEYLQRKQVIEFQITSNAEPFTYNLIQVPPKTSGTVLVQIISDQMGIPEKETILLTNKDEEINTLHIAQTIFQNHGSFIRVARVTPVL